MNDLKEYWNNRASNGVLYNGERFYTITPIPYYYERRKIILNNIFLWLYKKKEENSELNCCDFGCGDGRYIYNLCDKFNTVHFHGLDYSENMINQAKTLFKDNPNISFEVSETGIKDKFFDFVYSSAIWAHIEEDKVNEYFRNINQYLNKDGIFILCERIGPYRKEEKINIRRTLKNYSDLLESNNFKIIDSFIIDFWLHRILFEWILKRIFIKIKKTFSKNLTSTEILLSLNNNILYRFLSKVLTRLSKPCISKKKNGYGYCFIVSRKQELSQK